MKKLFIILSLLIFVFSSVDATPYTDTVSNNIGLTINDVDKVALEIYEGTNEVSSRGDLIQKVLLSGCSNDSIIYKFFWFKITVTSSHKLKLKLSTEGPLKLEGGTELIDYTLYHCSTFNEDGTAASGLVLSSNTVFGYDAVNKVDVGYNEQNYYELGTNGYLNINDPIWGWFYISVNKSDINGKTAGKYITYIYLTAETTS